VNVDINEQLAFLMKQKAARETAGATATGLLRSMQINGQIPQHLLPLVDVCLKMWDEGVTATPQSKA
jgi:hypothetical protein